jgi:hypothetical protein
VFLQKTATLIPTPLTPQAKAGVAATKAKGKGKASAKPAPAAAAAAPAAADDPDAPPPAPPAAGGPKATLLVAPLSVLSNWTTQLEVTAWCRRAAGFQI